MATNVLETKAILAGVKIRRWTGRRLDLKVTDEINTSKGASTDAGRYNKQLLSKTAFKEVNAVRSAARQKHYAMTLPWMDEGTRILPSVLFEEFSKLFRQFRQDFDDAADAFARDYPKFLEDSKKRLKGMYAQEDFPLVGEIRSRFSLDTYILPWPDRKDFRVDLTKDTLDDFEARVTAQVQDAVKEPYRRIVETVGYMAERLKGYKPKAKEGVFRDSLVTNVQDLAKLLPAFNLTGSKDLTTMIAKIEKDLCKYEADALREDDTIRKTVAKSAEDILKKAEALMM